MTIMNQQNKVLFTLYRWANSSHRFNTKAILQSQLSLKIYQFKE